MYTKEHLLQLVQMTMPFGKYQGKRICDIPEEYLLWMQKKGFPQGHLGDLLAMMLEIVDAVASRHGLKINAAKTEIVDFSCVSVLLLVISRLNMEFGN